jgi:hypothetical protein
MVAYGFDFINNRKETSSFYGARFYIELDEL